MYRISTERRVFREEYRIYTEVNDNKVEKRIWVSRNNVIVEGRRIKKSRIKDEYVYKNSSDKELVPLTVYEDEGIKKILLTGYTGCVVVAEEIEGYLESVCNEPVLIRCVDGTEIEFTQDTDK